MRVPVLSADLPEKFNKVAKYIGRHWPNGKLSLNKSREALAYLFGYNSVHEVNQAAPSNKLPHTIMLNKIFTSMIGKALYKYSIRPDSFDTVLRKAPFKELAFYTVSDIEQERIRIEKLRESSGMMIYNDEYQDILNYKSPALIVEQHKKSLVPPYRYALNKKGEIFCSSTYESILNDLGNIQELLCNLDHDISVSEFIEKHVFPLAWLPVEKYLENVHFKERACWHVPYMVDIRQLRLSDDELNYALFHKGYNTYYPVACKTIESVNDVLTKIYKAEIVTPNNLFDRSFRIGASIRPKEKANKYLSEQTLKNAEQINIDGQLFIKEKQFQPYTQLISNEILKSVLWNTPNTNKIGIHKNLIDENIYSDHLSIKKSRDELLKSAIQMLKHVETADIRKIVQFVFGGVKLSLKSIIANEYDEDYELEETDLSKWNNVGVDVLKVHPELNGIIDNAAAGYLYCDYANYIKGDRYAWCCEKRDIAFIGYTLSNSSVIKGSRTQSEDDVFTATLLLAAYSNSSTQYDLDKFSEYYADIITMLTLHYWQEQYISKMEKYAFFLSNKDPLYLTHGEKVHYSENSSGELMQEAMKLGRKTNAHTYTAEENISDLK